MQFSASRAISHAFQLLGTSFGKLVAVWFTFFVGIAALLVAFGGMLMAMMRLSMVGGGGGGFVPGQNPLAGMGFSVVLFYLLYFLVIFAQQIALSRASTGRDEDTYSVALNAGLRGSLTMMGVLFVYIIAGIGGGIVVSLLMAAIVAATQSPGMSFLLGLILLFGVFYLFSRLSVVLPVIGIGEVRNPLTAISTAWRLTAGNSIKIMLLWGLTLIGAAVIYFIAMAATVGLPGAVTPGTAPGAGVMFSFLAVMIVLGLSIGLYMVTLTTALYDQLSPSSIVATAEAFE